MKIVPLGERILIKPEPIEEISKGGIVVTVGDNKKSEQAAQVRGTVLALGAQAYREYDEPWCKVGDTILYQKYSGMRVPGDDGKLRDDLLILNDLDITGRVETETREVLN